MKNKRQISNTLEITRRVQTPRK